MPQPWARNAPPHRITVSQFIRVFDRELAETEPRLELIEGRIVAMNPPDPPHTSAINRLDLRLRRAYGRGFVMWLQGSWRAEGWSFPQPDIAVLRGRERTFDKRFPTGKDTVLIVEVSWTSHLRDLEKVKIYAQARVPTYWRLDLDARALEVYEEPSRTGYLQTTYLSSRDSVRVPETRKSLKVADLLPRR